MKSILWGVLIFASLLLSSYTLFEFTTGTQGCYNEGISAVPSENGGWLVSGAYNCEGNPTGWKSRLLHLTAQGDTTYLTKDLPYNGLMRKMPDGNLIFAGGNRAGFTYDTAMIFKVHPSGELLWKRSVFAGYCQHVLTDILPAEDGFYLTGYYAQGACSSPVYDAFVAKLNSTGEVIWTHIMSNAGNDQFHVVRKMKDGNIAAFGWTENKSSADDADYVLVKLDASGNKIWSKTFGGDLDNYGYGMDVTSENGFILNGHSATMDVLRLDAEGNVLWNKSLTETCGGRYFKAYCSEDGGYVFLGMEKSAGQCKSALIKTTDDGEIFWKKNFPGVLRSVEQNNPGSFLLTGYKAYLPKLYVVAFDSTSIPNVPHVQHADLSDHELYANEAHEEEDTTSTGTLEEHHHIKQPVAFPNPSERIMNIEFDNTMHQLYQLEVFDANGRLVLKEEGKKERFVINDENISKGMYSYKLSGAGNVFYGKILFQ